MNPPSFLGSKADEDPQEFLDQVQKVTDIMGVTSSEGAELATYQLQDVAHTWFKKWKLERADDAGSVGWERFASTFLDRFFSPRAQGRQCTRVHQPQEGQYDSERVFS